MRAVLVREYGGIERAALAEVPRPAPKANEVLVEVNACAVNFVDLIMIAGKYQFQPGLPFIPGKLPVGVVAAPGPAVQALKPGDRVLAMAEYGGYAEFVAAPEAQCIKLPAALSFVEAASMALVYDTAWFALRDRARLERGETVLVLGATGGVGLAAIGLAKAFGARVLAGVASADKADLVRDAGADAIVDLARADLAESLRAQVFALTDERGVDVILDPLGGDVFDAAIRTLAWRGRLVVIGFAAGRIPTLKMNYVMLKNIEVMGLQISDYRKRRPGEMAACFAEIFSLHAAGKLKALPTTTYPLEKFADALRAVQDRSARGRIVLTMT